MGRATNLALARTTTLVEGGTRDGGGAEARAWRSGDGELEGLLPLGWRPENGGGRAAAGDRRVAPEGALLARRWPTSGQKREGSLLGCGIYRGRHAGDIPSDRPAVRRRHKCLLFNQLRHASEWAKGLTTGNQNANTDPPKVPNKLINPTNSDRPIGANSDLRPTP